MELEGVWPDENKFVGRYFVNSLTKKLYVSSHEHYDGDNPSCTRSEFEQVKAEMQNKQDNSWHERDRLIDQGEKDIRSLSPEIDRDVIARLIDAGWKPTNEE